MANPNIVNITSLYGNLAIQSVSSITANIVQNASSSGQAYRVNFLSISNVSTNNYSITAEVNVAGSNAALLKNAVIPANSALTIIAKDTSFYLTENSSIQLYTSQNSAFQAVCSWEQLS